MNRAQMKTALSKLHFLGLAVLLVGAASLARADLAVQVGGPFGLDESNNSWVLGYSFTANSNISVTGLGIFDNNAPGGLTSAHDVGLWDSMGNLIASTSVPAGLAANIISNWAFESISPINLTAGQTYTVGAEVTVAQGDNWVADPTTFVVAQQITYDSRKFQIYSGVLIEPDLVGGNSIGYFGGNIEFGPTAVPEPGFLVPLALAMVAIALIWRRKAVC